MSTQVGGQNGKTRASKESQKFRDGEIVWAKVRGYSWWPAKIGKKENNGDKEGKYRVNFIGDKTYQDLPEDKLADFISNYIDYAKIKKRDLQDAIEQAKKLLSQDEQSAIERLLRNEDTKAKQSEKGGNNEKVDVEKEEKINVKQIRGSQILTSAKGLQPDMIKQSVAKSTAISHSSCDHSTTPTKASAKDLQISSSKGSSSAKKQDQSSITNIRDQARTLVKQKTPVMNRRNLKTLQKQSARDRKYTKDSRSEGDASRDLIDEMEDEESQIICTKSKTLSINHRNKRLKKTAKLESDAESEVQEVQNNDIMQVDLPHDEGEQEDKKVLNSTTQIDEDTHNNQIIGGDQEVMKVDSSEIEECKSEQSIFEEPSCHKDVQEPLPKERRQSAQQAIKVIQSVTTKQPKSLSKSKIIEKRQTIDKPRTPQTKTGDSQKQNSQLVKMSSQKNLCQTKPQTSSGSDSTRHSPYTNIHQGNKSLKGVSQSVSNITVQNQASHIQSATQCQVTKECTQISKTIRNIIKFQQQEEEQFRKKNQLDKSQIDILAENKECLLMMQQQVPTLYKHLMQLQKTEITLKILEDTGIAKTLKYLSDYCELYKREIPPLQSIFQNIQALLLKWKNYVTKQLFEEKSSHIEDFQKEKYRLKVEKLEKKSGAKNKSSNIVQQDLSYEDKQVPQTTKANASLSKITEQQQNQQLIQNFQQHQILHQLSQAQIISDDEFKNNTLLQQKLDLLKRQSSQNAQTSNNGIRSILLQAALNSSNNRQQQEGLARKFSTDSQYTRTIQNQQSEEKLQQTQQQYQHSNSGTYESGKDLQQNLTQIPQLQQPQTIQPQQQQPLAQQQALALGLGNLQLDNISSIAQMLLQNIYNNNPINKNGSPSRQQILTGFQRPTHSNFLLRDINPHQQQQQNQNENDQLKDNIAAQFT
eukprot:403332144